MRPLSSFTKEELKNYPPIPEYLVPEASSPNFDPKTAGWEVTDGYYWLEDEKRWSCLGF